MSFTETLNNVDETFNIEHRIESLLLTSSFRQIVLDHYPQNPWLHFLKRLRNVPTRHGGEYVRETGETAKIAGVLQ